MAFQDTCKKISAKLFNKTVEKHLDSFRGIHEDLKMSNMGIMLREYLSICFFTALITAFVSFPVSLLIFMLLGQAPIFAFLLSLIATAGATTGAFMISLQYPAIKKAQRKKNIDNNLPFATLYMNTIAGTGAPIDTMFRVLSEFEEYGEVSKEAQEIIEDIDVLGQDLEDALKRAAEKSPSENFRDLLWGMVTTIVRGGDLKSLLQDQAEYFMARYRRKMTQYADDLSMYVEIYITLVIVGSIFSLVMLTIMGAISGFQELKFMQQFIVFVFLPLTSIGFLLLLKLTSPFTS